MTKSLMLSLVKRTRAYIIHPFGPPWIMTPWQIQTQVIGRCCPPSPCLPIDRVSSHLSLSLSLSLSFNFLFLSPFYFHTAFNHSRTTRKTVHINLFLFIGSTKWLNLYYKVGLIIVFKNKFFIFLGW